MAICINRKRKKGLKMARRSSLVAATVFFFKETQVKSLAWIRTKDIILKKQGTRMAHIYIVRLILFQGRYVVQLVRDTGIQLMFEFPFIWCHFLNAKLASSRSSLIFIC
jgi:hypothetical protein